MLGAIEAAVGAGRYRSRSGWGGWRQLWRLHGQLGNRPYRLVKDGHLHAKHLERDSFFWYERLRLYKPGRFRWSPLAHLGCLPRSFTDSLTGGAFGHPGEMFLAQVGDFSPMTQPLPEPRGYRVVRVNLATGQESDFYVNLTPNREGNCPERPVAVKFSPDGSALYILDFGLLQTFPMAMVPKAGSGLLKRNPSPPEIQTASARSPPKNLPHPCARSARTSSPIRGRAPKTPASVPWS